MLLLTQSLDTPICRVLDAFAAQLRLTLCVFDPDGAVYAGPAGVSDKTCPHFDHEREGGFFASGQFQAELSDLEQIRNPVFLETVRGEMSYLAPMRCGIGDAMYIWIGVFPQALKLQVSTDSKPLIRCIEAMLFEARYPKYRANLLGTVNSAIDEPFDHNRFLAGFQQVMLADFAGYIERRDGDLFERVCSTHAADDEANTFPVHKGEGFWGQTLLTGRIGYWNAIENDPRSEGFHRSGIRPKCLAAFPVAIDKEIVGILYCGNTQRAEMGRNEMLFGQTLSAGLTLAVRDQWSVREKSEQKMKESLMIDFGQAMLHHRSEPEVLKLASEIPRMIGATATRVQWKMDGEVLTVCSGQWDADWDSVTGFMSGGEPSDASLRMPDIRHGSDAVIIEFPLYLESDWNGAFCASFESESLMQRSQSFLRVMALVTEIHLNRIRHLQAMDAPGVTLLLEAARLWKPDLYKKALRAREHVLKFCRQAGWEEARLDRLGAASALQCMEPELQRLCGNAALVKLLEDGLDFAKKQSGESIDTSSKDMQLLRLVETYMHEDEQAEAVVKLPVERELKENFYRYAKSAAAGGTDLSMEATSEIANSDSAKSGSTDCDELGLSVGLLTKREREVLHLVVEGCSNQEIAQRLFISTHTVKNHMTKIYEKLGVTDRSQAMAKVFQTQNGHRNH